MNIKLKLDLTKIDKNKLFKSETTGSIYLDAVMIEKKTEYNDWMVVQNTTKEERAAGERGAIIGNGSYIVPKEPESAPISESDDLPW